jgi:DNA-binding transcriptional MerR regulator
VEPTFYTPAEVAQILGVSAPSVRRMALVYEEMFQPLPRDDRGHRHWPQEALRRTQAAHQALGTGRVVSLAAALKLIAEGGELPVAHDLDLPGATPAPDVLGEVLEELRRLREVVEAQHLELSALRQEVSGLRELPAPAPATGPVPDVNEKLAEIWESVHSVQSSLEVQGALDSERMRVLLHAYNEALPPRPAGLTGWLAALFKR